MSGPRFTMVYNTALKTYCTENRLSARARALLDHLIREANWQTRSVENFVVKTCAEEFCLAPAAGRATLARWMGELTRAGAVQYTPGRGSASGRVVVRVYDVLVKQPRGQADPSVLAGDPAESRRAIHRATARDTSRAGNGAHPLSPAGLHTPSLDVDVGSSPGGKPTIPPEVDHLCHQLLEKAAEAGVAHDPGPGLQAAVTAALDTAPAAEVGQAVGWALGDEWWLRSGCDLTRLVQKFPTLQRQAARARPAEGPARALLPRDRLIPEGVRGGVLQL